MSPLEARLAAVAERIVEHGTASETRVLRQVSAAILAVRPGVSAALVDWDGAEVARQRAFGIAHGVVVTELTPQDRAVLLDQILGTGLALAG